MVLLMVRTTIIALLVIGASTAAAEPDRDRTRAAMDDYFTGEKRGGFTLVGMGAAGLLAGGLMLRSDNLTLKGASYPLLGVGVLHLAAGIFVYVSSANRQDQFADDIQQDPTAFLARERPRMRGVSTQLTVLKIVEVVLIAGGLTMAGIGHRTDRPRLRGAGLALAAEMSLTLGFDIFAARRAHTYRDELAAVDVQAAVDQSGVPVALITHTFSF
jgi:hypothetical protein